MQVEILNFHFLSWKGRFLRYERDKLVEDQAYPHPDWHLSFPISPKLPSVLGPSYMRHKLVSLTIQRQVPMNILCKMPRHISSEESNSQPLPIHFRLSISREYVSDINALFSPNVPKPYDHPYGSALESNKNLDSAYLNDQPLHSTWYLPYSYIALDLLPPNIIKNINRRSPKTHGNALSIS